MAGSIARGIPLFSGRGALHVASAFAMWMLPGYALYRFNVSDLVKVRERC